MYTYYINKFIFRADRAMLGSKEVTALGISVQTLTKLN
jgi:hypothetical protein